MIRDLVLAFDIGGTSIRGALAASDGEIIAEARVATVKYAGQRDYGQLFVALRHDLAGRAGVAASDIRAAGVAVAGIVDGDTGRIVLCPNICDLPAFDLCGIMSEALGLDDVRIENDVNLAAVGEHLRGVAQGCDNLFS